MHYVSPSSHLETNHPPALARLFGLRRSTRDESTSTTSVAEQKQKNPALIEFDRFKPFAKLPESLVDPKDSPIVSTKPNLYPIPIVEYPSNTYSGISAFQNEITVEKVVTSNKKHENQQLQSWTKSSKGKAAEKANNKLKKVDKLKEEHDKVVAEFLQSKSSSRVLKRVSTADSARSLIETKSSSMVISKPGPSSQMKSKSEFSMVLSQTTSSGTMTTTQSFDRKIPEKKKTLQPSTSKDGLKSNLKARSKSSVVCSLKEGRSANNQKQPSSASRSKHNSAADKKRPSASGKNNPSSADKRRPSASDRRHPSETEKKLNRKRSSKLDARQSSAMVKPGSSRGFVTESKDKSKSRHGRSDAKNVSRIPIIYQRSKKDQDFSKLMNIRCKNLRGYADKSDKKYSHIPKINLDISDCDFLFDSSHVFKEKSNASLAIKSSASMAVAKSSTSMVAAKSGASMAVKSSTSMVVSKTGSRHQKSNASIHPSRTKRITKATSRLSHKKVPKQERIKKSKSFRTKKPPSETKAIKSSCFKPMTYHFSSKCWDCVLNDGSMPPFWALVDNLVAVVWLLHTNKNTKKQGLGIIQLSWALELLMSIQNKFCHLPEPLSTLINIIEETINHRYSEMEKAKLMAFYG